MQIKYSKNYDKKIKKLKKHQIEYNNLKDILKIIDRADNFSELINLPIVQMYNFERLKYQNKDYYSFNLAKGGGVIRLIVKPDTNNCVIMYIADITLDHYKDFDFRKVVYYE